MSSNVLSSLFVSTSAAPTSTENVSEAPSVASLQRTYNVLSAIGAASHQDLLDRQTAFDHAWLAAGGGTLRSPSLGGTSTTSYLGAMLDDINARREELGLAPYEPLCMKDGRPVTRCRAYGCTDPNCQSIESEPVAIGAGAASERPPRFPVLTAGTPPYRPVFQQRSVVGVPNTSALRAAAPLSGTPPAERLLPCQECRDRISHVSPGTPEGSVPLCREGPEYSPLLCDACRRAYADPQTYLPPPPPLRRVNAFRNDDSELALSPPPRFPSVPRVSEDDVGHSLRMYRAQLQGEQDNLYHNCSTEQEFAAKDIEYDRIARKIHAIEQCMTVLGAPFRLR